MEVATLLVSLSLTFSDAGLPEGLLLRPTT